MSISTFLAKADALEKIGVGALRSPDFRLLYREADAAGKSYRATIAADKRAKRTPHSCPPKNASVNSDQLIAHLRTYPEAVRPKTTITTAMFDVMKKRHPCA
jgi:hypothetical protein